MEKITRRAAMEIINSGNPFDIEYVSCDQKRGTAGALKAYTQVFRNGQTMKETARRYSPAGTKPVKRKDHLFHLQNSAFNIYVQQEPEHNKRIKKVHEHLITKVNGKEVI